MPVNLLLENDTFVVELRHSIRDGSAGLSNVPGLLKCILKDARWKRRTIKTGEVVEFRRFEEFVATPPLEGLGTDLKLIKRICGDDPEALDLLDGALKGKHGGDRRKQAGKSDNVRLEDVTAHNAGNSDQYALRRLREGRPDLHARVLARELSPHAAMIEAGFRRRSITIPADPEGAARRLRRHFRGEQLDELVRLLQDSDSPDS
jgi:hypothetical protein